MSNDMLPLEDDQQSCLVCNCTLNSFHTAREGCMRILCGMELYLDSIQPERAVRIKCEKEPHTVVFMQPERVM